MKICTGNASYDINKWLRHYYKVLQHEELAQNTIDLYHRVLENFSNFIELSNIQSIKDIEPKEIEAFLSWLERRYCDRTGREHFTFSNSTRRLYIVALKAFFDYIEENAELENDGTQYSFDYIFKVLNKRKRGRKARHRKAELKYLNQSQVTDLLDYLDRRIENRGKHYDYIYSLAVRLMIYGGLRISETLGLRISDLQYDGDLTVIRLEDTKSGSIQYVPIRTINIQKELNYIKRIAKNKECYVIANKSLNTPLKRTNFYAKMNNIYNEAGLNRNTTNKEDRVKGVHILRHTAAMMLLDKTHDITYVKELLRHSNISTTSIYTHRDVNQLGQKVV